MEQNIEVYAKKGYALKGYALGGICLKGICLRGNMPNRFYALKGICLDTVKFYAKKGLCLKKLCPKGIMPYDSMPNYRQTKFLTLFFSGPDFLFKSILTWCVEIYMWTRKYPCLAPTGRQNRITHRENISLSGI